MTFHHNFLYFKEHLFKFFQPQQFEKNVQATLASEAVQAGQLVSSFIHLCLL